MESPIHTLKNMFKQLGLPSTSRDIENFIEQHKPLAARKAVYKLDCFTPSQQSFLKKATEQDADWTVIADTLNTLLGQPSDIRPS